MDYTKKFKLSKPSYSDDVDIQILNNNFDIIDSKLQTVSVSDNTLHVDDNNYPLNFLPLNGGTMTGDIKLDNLIGLFFSDKSKLNFDNTETLNISADKLNCNIAGKPFIIDNNSVTYDGNTLIFAENGDNFVKLSNGLIIQWGFVDYFSDATRTITITLPTPMKNNNYVPLVCRGTNTQRDINETSTTFGDYTYTQNNTTTSFNLIIRQYRVKTPYLWLVVGGI